MPQKSLLSYSCALIGALLLAAVFGYLLGRLVTARFSLPDVPIVLRGDDRSEVPVVRLEGIRDGDLVGSVSGDVRFFLGDDLILPDGSGTLSAPAGPLLVNEITVEVPAWAQFVASSKGKKYYPVYSSQGERIVPENRVYFETEEEADLAGYEA